MGSTPPACSRHPELTTRLSYQHQTDSIRSTVWRFRLQANPTSSSRYPVLVHDKPSARCSRRLVRHSAKRKSDAIAWFPTQVAMPAASSFDLAIADVKTSSTLFRIRHPPPHQRATLNSLAALEQLASIFATATNAALEQLASTFATVTNVRPTTMPSKTSIILPGFTPLLRVSAANPSDLVTALAGLA